MKKFIFGVVTGSLFVIAISSSMAQQSPHTRYDELRSKVADLIDSGASSIGWKTIGDDVAIRIYTDRYGFRRATIGVRVGDTWEPVAVDGQEALLPPAIPAR